MEKYETPWNHQGFLGSGEPSLRLVLRPNSAKLAKYPVHVFCAGTPWETLPGGIPGILPISPIFVRFCLRSRGKSYHRLIVLAVECLVVLVGYTSK